MTNKELTWKERLDHITKLYALGINQRDRWNFKGLYIELEHECDRLLKAHKMPVNSKYTIPYEDGRLLILYPDLNGTALKQISEDGKETILISKEASVAKEYSSLELFTSALTGGSRFVYGIGEKYPDTFATMFRGQLPRT